MATTILAKGMAHDLHFHDQFKVDIDGTTGLNFAYNEGRRKPDGTLVASSTIAVTDDATSYIYLDSAGAVATGATIPTTATAALWQVTAASGSITVVTDIRDAL
jgi:hypothetical protein